MKKLLFVICMFITGCTFSISEQSKDEITMTKKKYAENLADVGESAFREGVRCGVIIGNAEKCNEGIHQAYMESLNKIGN